MNDRLFFTYTDDAKYHQDDGFVNAIHNIYQHIPEEQSKGIFINRLLFSLTGDFQFASALVEQTIYGKRFADKLKGRDAYIYGAGIRGERMLRLYPQLCWRGFIDKYKSGNISGTTVYGIKDIPDKKNAFVVISNVLHSQEIQDELIENGYTKENIFDSNEWDEKAAQNQYFDEEIIDINKMKLKLGGFVDCGGFDGSDTVSFYKMVQDMDRQAFVFEPVSENIEKCREVLKEFPYAEIFPYACSDKEDVTNITNMGEASSLVNKNGIHYGDCEQIQCVKLDDILKNEEVSMIKMDVEGCEDDAIRGGTEIIRKQRPVLAISIYHKREDIWQLPKSVLDIDSRYQFFFRHYRIGLTDTVMYAIPE